LLKQVAQVSGMTQDEAARLTEIRAAAPMHAVRAAPPRGADRVMLSLDRNPERELLKCLLAHPPLALDVPIEIVDGGHIEGRALASLLDLEGIGELTHAAILEAFRDSEHEPVLERIASEFMDKPLDVEVAKAVFSDAITAIRMRNPHPRIKELEQKDAREGLSGPEYEEYRRLIAEDAALKQRRMPPSAPVL
jgi:hypothetical protein